MTKAQNAVSPPLEKTAMSKRSALLAALSLLSASLGIAASEGAQAAEKSHGTAGPSKKPPVTTTSSKVKVDVQQDITANKAKTADKKAKAVDDYIRQ